VNENSRITNTNTNVLIVVLFTTIT